MKKWDYVNDWFTGRLHEGIEEAFYDFQTEYGIEDGDLPPEMNDRLADAVDRLISVMDACMAYQKRYNK